MSVISMEQSGPITEPSGHLVSAWAPSACWTPAIAGGFQPMAYPTSGAASRASLPAMRKAAPAVSPYAGMFEHGAGPDASPAEVQHESRLFQAISSALGAKSDLRRSRITNFR